ncbi:MAG: endonuclease/exonuclease/phosphatase family protein [Patescibacteria group bacterium]|nr:endonuclease/exonuclease/phosphatase family protein [Patescibacteria group bacterium]
MKLISLNTWGGKAYAPLMQFIKEHAPTTDIFCFQEILSSPAPQRESHGARTNLYGELAEVLPNFQKFFTAEQSGYDLDEPVDFPISYGQATFIKNSVHVLSTEEVFVYRDRNSALDVKTFPASILCTRIAQEEKTYSIMNMHGIAHPEHHDTPDRLMQSEKILRFLEKEEGIKLLCGDFNLRPETLSLALIEKTLLNLNKKFNIPQTRSILSPYFGKKNFDPTVDYILVSPEVETEQLEVPDVQISDHLPLILEFS